MLRLESGPPTLRSCCGWWCPVQVLVVRRVPGDKRASWDFCPICTDFQPPPPPFTSFGVEALERVCVCAAYLQGSQQEAGTTFLQVHAEEPQQQLHINTDITFRTTGQPENMEPPTAVGGGRRLKNTL